MRLKNGAALADSAVIRTGALVWRGVRAEAAPPIRAEGRPSAAISNSDRSKACGAARFTILVKPHPHLGVVHANDCRETTFIERSPARRRSFRRDKAVRRPEPNWRQRLNADRRGSHCLGDGSKLELIRSASIRGKTPFGKCESLPSGDQENSFVAVVWFGLGVKRSGLRIGARRLPHRLHSPADIRLSIDSN